MANIGDLGNMTDTTLEELMRIALMWGYSVDIKSRPSGFTEAGLIFGKLKFTDHCYQTERAAINDMLSMIHTQAYLVVENIENE